MTFLRDWKVPETQEQKAESTDLIGEFRKELWRSPDSNWCVCVLANNEKVCGNVEPGELIRGCPYRFVGEWKDGKYGLSFHFKAFIQHAPVSRDSIVLYLSKHCQGIGPAIAHRLVDEFGRENAIPKLKNYPEECAERVKLLNSAVAVAASKILKLNEQNEYAKLQLMELLNGYGFPGELTGKLIESFSIKAAERIRKDPWVLLRYKFPGCGFLRVDRLYCDLGHPEDSIDRQTFAAWHFLKSSMSGSTWFTLNDVESYLRKVITGGIKLKEAVENGIKDKLVRVEKSGGVTLIADERNALEEEVVAYVLGLQLEEVEGGDRGYSGEVGDDPGERGIVSGKRPRKITFDLGLGDEE